MEWFSFLKNFLTSYSTEVAYFSLFILALGLFQNFVYVVQLLFAVKELIRVKWQRQDQHSWWLLTSDITVPVSIIIPAYNEEITIKNSVKAALTIQYPEFELVVVNDGSKDKTLEILTKEFNLKKIERFYEKKLEHKQIKAIYTSSIYPQLVVVDKENGGRADALNAGVDVSRKPVFCTLDADSILDPSALLKAVQPFIDDPEHIVATGGTVRILNGCEVENSTIKKVKLTRKLIPLFQVVEYIRAFLMGRMAWSRFKIVTILSGAFGIFKRDLAIKIGGFTSSSLAEDFDLVMKIHQHCRKHKPDYKIKFVPQPVCWTEVPESWEVLRSQRIRWQQGGLEVFFKNGKTFFNPKYGRIGMVASPLIFIFDVLGPLAELFGYILIPLFYLLGLLNVEFLITFLCFFFVFGIFISIMSLVLEEISLKRFSNAKSLLILGFAAIIENFGYRQFNNVWRIIGWWRFLTKKKKWGNMKRVGVE